jgi:hypothetical protein
MNHLRKSALVVLGWASLSFGQWDVTQLSASTVKQTGPTGTVSLKLDSLDLDVTISGGLVRTRATMTWTPDSLGTRTTRWISDCTPEQALKKDTSCAKGTYVYDIVRGIPVDSLEVRSALELPLDAAVTGMWFWMNGQKVPSYVMDRWKAREQYNQIVGARRDPALLETWGGGSYYLSLFPLKSGHSSKLEIEFVQPVREGLVLPVMARGMAYRYDYVNWQYVYDTLRPAGVSVSVRSDAPTGTRLDLAGLGQMAVGSEPVVKIWSSPDSLVATLRGRQSDVWTAVGNGKGAFGANMVFKGTELNFEPEPSTRVVVLDANDSLDRVRKLALLSLLKYGKAPNKINLAWNDGNGLRHLWTESVSLDDEHGLEALRFLKSWTPSAKSDPKSILKQVVKSDSGSVVVLISTAPYETFALTYPGYPTDWTDSAKVKAYRAYSDSSDKFWKRINAEWNSIGQEMSSAGQALFGWWNDGYVGNASSLTGGYSFGSVTYPWRRWWMASDSISAPALYGPARFGYRESPTNLKLEIEGVQHDSLATLFQRNWGYGRWSGLVPMRETMVTIALDRAVSFSARSAATGSGDVSDDSLPVVFSARYAHGGNAKLRIGGTWGGLKFKGSRNVVVPEPSGTDWGTRVWAGEYANMAQPWIWSDTTTQAAVRAIGKGYGIVTPATSFLALEPGTKPLDSSAVQTNGTSDAVAASSLVLDTEKSSSTVDERNASAAIDATSLDDLFLGRISSIKNGPAEIKPVGLRILTGSVVNLEVVGHDRGDASIRILDLKGREVAKLAMTRTGDRFTASWTPVGRGLFFAVAAGDRWKHTSGFTVGR